MLWFPMGVTIKEGQYRNERIRATLKVDRFRHKVTMSRRIWYGHVKRPDDGEVGGNVLDMQLPRKRKRESSKRRYMVVVKDDMKDGAARED